MNPITVRIPPSPTGLFHVGTARTALYNYLFARKNKGNIILRMEDTDRERSSKEYEEDIIQGLQKLNLLWDGDVIHQTKRIPIYKKYLESLLKTEKAYYCFCTKEELDAERAKREAQKLPPRYSGKCADIALEESHKRIASGEKTVIRFRVSSSEEIIFEDLIRGAVKIHAKELDDFVIAKNLEEPLYNFCAVIDDYEMSISHVIRGEDHISNTPKQILLFRAFDWIPPLFAHLPLILNSDRSKLSKRKNKVSVDDYLSDGILPEALLNFLVLIGWSPEGEEEIFSLETLVEQFSLDRVHKGGAVFDPDRLLWINGVWIRKKTAEEFSHLAQGFLTDPLFIKGRKKYGEEFYQKALSLVHERTKKLSELPEFLRFFFVDDDELSYAATLFENAKMKTTKESAKEALRIGKQWINDYKAEFSHGAISEFFLGKIAELGWKNGQMLWPLRIALSGEAFSPGTFELLEAFGKDRSLARIERAEEILERE
jgi:glutamyl-tRNA synthetase